MLETLRILMFTVKRKVGKRVILFLAILLFSSVSAFAEYSPAEKRILKEKVRLHLEAMYKGAKYIIKWEYPEITYFSFMYDSPETNYQPPQEVDKIIDTNLKEIAKITGLKFKRASKLPKDNNGVILLGFTKNFHHTLKTDPHMERIFFRTLKKKHRSWDEYLMHTKRKNVLKLSTLAFDNRSANLYVYIQDLKDNSKYIIISFFSAFTNSNLSNQIVPSLANDPSKHKFQYLQPFDRIFLKYLYSKQFRHGSPLSKALPVLTSLISRHIIQQEILIAL